MDRPRPNRSVGGPYREMFPRAMDRPSVVSRSRRGVERPSAWAIGAVGNSLRPPNSTSDKIYYVNQRRYAGLEDWSSDRFSDRPESSSRRTGRNTLEAGGSSACAPRSRVSRACSILECEMNPRPAPRAQRTGSEEAALDSKQGPPGEPSGERSGDRGSPARRPHQPAAEDHLEHDDTDSSNPAEISKVAPVTVKIGEGRGNLRRREEWFRRR
jgi:hypothetical protein